MHTRTCDGCKDPVPEHRLVPIAVGRPREPVRFEVCSLACARVVSFGVLDRLFEDRPSVRQLQRG